ncbi:unnamed protein product [Effrenium voratum]|nr:unnamed protein product [Effrenium voratum]
MSETFIVQGVSSVLCRQRSLQYTVEGSTEAFQWTASASLPCALLVRGHVFAEAEALPWPAVAQHLAQVAPQLPELRRYFSSRRGSFWVVYALLSEDQLRVFAVTEPVGRVPLCMGEGKGELLLSPYWPLEQVPLAAGIALEALQLRQACPRLLHHWSAKEGLSSALDAFYGLHAEVELPEGSGSDDLTTRLRSLLLRSVERCLWDVEHVGLLFSGGLDSGLLAWILTEKKLRCTGYTVGFHVEKKKNKYAYPEDLSSAEAAARELGLEWKAHVMNLEEAEELLLRCAPVVADWNSVKAAVGMTMLDACRLAAKDGLRVVLSGLGSEEAFAGYARHLRACAAGDAATAKDRTLGLASMWHRDLQRDFAVAAQAGVEIRYPFLDDDLLALALKLPAGACSREATESEAADGGKGALRAVARSLGAPRCISERRKRAAQYGSRVYNALKLLSNQAGKRLEASRFHQANYVMSVPGASHSRLALLFTSGYHSVQVYCLLKSWRFAVACIVPSDSPAAFAAAAEFAAAEGVPLARKSAKMEAGNGYDVPALIDALRCARDEYGVEACACGHVCALDLWCAVVAACDAASLRSVAPEWGVAAGQSTMRRIVHDGTVLQVSKFPDPSLLGALVTCPEDADAVLSALRSLVGPDATDDTDAGFVDCDFASSAFLACGLREVEGPKAAELREVQKAVVAFSRFRPGGGEGKGGGGWPFEHLVRVD